MQTDFALALRPFGLLAVLVVHRATAQSAQAWPFLQNALEHSSGADSEPSQRFQLLHVLIYDNSPTAQEDQKLESRISYVHDANNTGTAGAYTKAFAMAHILRCEWVLLLDHDTALPETYLESAHTAAKDITDRDGRILAPWVMHGELCVSPSRLSRWGGFGRLTPALASSVDTKSLTCIASGCFLDSKARSLIGAIPPELWLDFVDHWMVSRIHRGGGSLTVIEATLQHDLSVENPNDLSAHRLRSILAGERYFLAQCGWLARISYPLRLLVRAISYARQGSPIWRQVLHALRPQ
jgi:hypothetical protein